MTVLKILFCSMSFIILYNVLAKFRICCKSDLVFAISDKLCNCFFNLMLIFIVKFSYMGFDFRYWCLNISAWSYTIHRSVLSLLCKLQSMLTYQTMAEPFRKWLVLLLLSPITMQSSSAQGFKVYAYCWIPKA